MFSNGLVGSITVLSIIMLFWPLISKGISAVRGRPSAPAAGVTR